MSPCLVNPLTLVFQVHYGKVEQVAFISFELETLNHKATKVIQDAKAVA